MSEETREEERKRDIELCRRAAEQLGEYFDSVQIFVTRHMPEGVTDGTRYVAWGSGNWFTRYGQVSHWVEREKEDAREGVREDNRP